MTHGGWADDDAQIIAIDEHSALCLAAHDAGSPLWQVLVSGTTIDRLIAAVSAVYATTPDRLASDIDRLFAVFDDRGLMGA
jgi:hypothetical protein